MKYTAWLNIYCVCIKLRKGFFCVIKTMFYSLKVRKMCVFIWDNLLELWYSNIDVHQSCYWWAWSNRCRIWILIITKSKIWMGSFKSFSNKKLWTSWILIILHILLKLFANELMWNMTFLIPCWAWRCVVSHWYHIRF
jgi:hypothetical protein